MGESPDEGGLPLDPALLSSALLAMDNAGLIYDGGVRRMKRNQAKTKSTRAQRKKKGKRRAAKLARKRNR